MRIKGRSDIPDLQTQLESLFDQVWRCNWQLWGRIDAMVAGEVQRERRTHFVGLNPERDRSL